MKFTDRLFPFLSTKVFNDNLLTSWWIIVIILFFVSTLIYWFYKRHEIRKNITVETLPKSKSLKKLWDAYQATFNEYGSLKKTSEFSENYFNEQNVLYLSLNFKFVSNVSNTLVGLGILGTFVGLTYGIADSNFETTAAIKNSINNLLSGMGTAFVTSIWGMGLSLFFTIFFKAHQSTLSKEIQELCLDLDHNNKITSQELETIQNENQYKLVLEQQDYQRKLVTEQEENQIKLAQEQKENQIKLAQEQKENQIKLAQEQKKNQIKLAQEQKENQIKLAQDQKENQSKLAKEQQEHQRKLVAEYQENQRKIINEIFNEYLVADTDDGKQLPKNVFRQLLKESENQTLALQSFSDDLADSIKVTMENLVDNNNQQISKLIEEKLVPVLEDLKVIKQDTGTQVIEGVVNNLSDSLKVMMGDFKDTISTDTNQEMESLMKRLTIVSKSIVGVPATMSDITIQVAETIKMLRQTVSDNMEQSGREAIRLNTQNKELFLNATNEYKSTVDEIQAFMKSLLETQKENILQVSNIADEMKISIKDNSQVNLQINTMIQKSRIVAQLIENVSNKFETSSRTLIETSSSLKESMTSFGNSIENYVGKNENLLDHQEVTLQKTQEVADIYGSRFEVIEKGLTGIFGQIQVGLKDYEKTTASNLNQYLAEFSTVLKKAHEGLEHNVSGLVDITEELTEQMELMAKRK